MGLDSVEFVLAIEEAFQIAIPDAAAEAMRTPADVVAYLESRVGGGERSRCLEQAAFYRLRRAAMRLFGVQRQDVSSGSISVNATGHPTCVTHAGW